MFNPDDPKYTAYVLDELSDPQRAEIEAEMLANPAASALVREIRAATNELSAAFKTERLPELTAAQRETVLAAQIALSAPMEGEGSAAPIKHDHQPTRRPLVAAAIAASLLLAVGAGWLLRGLNLHSDRETAAMYGVKGDVAQKPAIASRAITETSAPLVTELTDNLAVVPGSGNINETVAAPNQSMRSASREEGEKFKRDALPRTIEEWSGGSAPKVAIIVNGGSNSSKTDAQALLNVGAAATEQKTDSKLSGWSVGGIMGNADAAPVASHSMQLGSASAGANGPGPGNLSGSGATTTWGYHPSGQSQPPNILTKNGAGTLTLSGANTYTGGTTLNAGTVKLNGGDVASNSSNERLNGALNRGYNVGGNEKAGQQSAISGASAAPGLNFKTIFNNDRGNETSTKALPGQQPSFGGTVNPSELSGLDPTGGQMKQRDVAYSMFGQGGGQRPSVNSGLVTETARGGTSLSTQTASENNSASHFNGPVTFPDRDDGQFNQFYGVLERTAGSPGVDKNGNLQFAVTGNVSHDEKLAPPADSLSDLQTRLSQVRTAIEFEKKASGEQDPNVRRLHEVALNLEARLTKRVVEDQIRAQVQQQHNTEAYDAVQDNPFLAAVENPLSTFSIDVDTASYSNIRRFLTQNNQLPPPGAARIEELVNYFRYDYPQPKDDKPFSVTTEVASCPWAADHRLVRIGLKGREIDADKRPLTNLVFLIDVSGSMQPANKLPLVRESLKMLTEKLGENDTVAIVVYAGSSGLVLPSTRGNKRDEIINAINRLSAGGSTNGAQGIELAYEIASQNFVKGGVNRVILATDGDFNVGVTSQDQLVKLIEEKAKTGVFLTTLGFGYGNIKDSTLEKLADKGNGNYAYIDDLREGHKVLVEQMSGTLVTIAKDVKIQVEFNPLEVAGYRLIGYENRMLAKEDFNNDKKDAGEIGAGHTVTALYEIVPAKDKLAPGSAGGRTTTEDSTATNSAAPKASENAPAVENATVDPLRYIQPAALTEAAKQGELFTLKLRYKQPDGDKSTLVETPVKDSGKKYGEASRDFQFASAVASFGLILRNSPYKGNATLAAVEELAKAGVDSESKTSDTGYRLEFIELAKKVNLLKGP